MKKHRCEYEDVPHVMPLGPMKYRRCRNKASIYCKRKRKWFCRVHHHCDCRDAEMRKQLIKNRPNLGPPERYSH